MNPENRIDHLLFTFDNAPAEAQVERAKEILGPARMTLARTVADLMLATGQIMPHELSAVGVVLSSRAAKGYEDAGQRAAQVDRVVRSREQSLGEAVHIRAITDPPMASGSCKAPPGFSAGLDPENPPPFERPGAVPVPEQTEDEPARKHAAPLGG